MTDDIPRFIIPLTVEELELMESLEATKTLLEQHPRIELKRDSRELSATPVGLEEIMNATAAEANQCEDAGVENRLQGVYDKALKELQDMSEEDFCSEDPNQ